MTWLWDQVMMAGWVAWLILLLAMIGVGASVGALIAAAVGSKRVREVGWACLGVAALCTGLGIGGMQLGRATVDEVLASGAISPTQRERIRRQGYLETQSAVVLGLMGCALPLLVGGVATAVGSIRRRKAALAKRQLSLDAPPPAGAPPAAADGGGLGWLVSLCLAVLAVLGVGGSAAGMMAPLPGRDLDVTDPAWALIEVVEEIEAGQLAEGCADLERIEATRPRGSDTSDGKVAGLEPAVDKCVDARIDSALKLNTAWERREKLTEIKERKGLFAPHEVQIKRIDEALGKLPGVTEDSALGIDPSRLGKVGTSSKGPRITRGKVVVSGRLPKEVVMRIVAQNYTRIRACYQAGLDRDPKLAGTVTVRFVIARNGASANIGAFGPLKDEKVRTCIANTFYRLTFPEPEGGVVTVSYPLELSPPSS